MTYNKIMLAGIVLGQPEFTINNFFGDALKITLLINRRDIGKIEKITCMITTPELIARALQEIHEGDFLVVSHAKLVTTNYDKNTTIVCPNCQEITYKQTRSERSDIIVYNYDVMEGMPLKESVGMNKVFLMGNICSPIIVNPTHGTNIKECIKYKLAVTRPGRKNQEKKADYPFIVSFNDLATTAEKYYDVGSMLFIEGSIQDRDITQKYDLDCQECGEISQPIIRSNVKEVIANRVARIRLHTESGNLETDELTSSLSNAP